IIFNPFLPKKWESWSFKINFRRAHLEVTMKKGIFIVDNHSEKSAEVEVWKTQATIKANSKKEFKQ
ncbi:MAG: hypothetical protein PF495_09480, partial [Spirochaetales bacterium]|nr:hypothetical protein [Spirochaetales bacterium]